MAATGARPAADGAASEPIHVQIQNTEERSSMLKSFTVYIVEISDFGRKYSIERRFDDFSKLHADLIEVDPNMPPIPEKKMWASTDAAVVAERKPAFERLLRHLLRSEHTVMEKFQTVFKFLELSAPAVVAFRYLFKAQRLNNARQCGRLTDPKYEKDHAYRLAHPSIVKMSLRLLATENALQEAYKASVAARAASKDAEEGAANAGYPNLGDAEGSPDSEKSRGESSAPKSGASQVQEAEAAIVEILRFAVASGGEQARKFFLQEKGLSVLLSFIFRKGKKDAAAAGGEIPAPDQRARNVLNGLIKAEGDKFATAFASFLSAGGVAVLSDGLDLMQQSQSYADFVSKLLWIAWDQDAQCAFLADSHSREALGLLSALFQCPSKGARVCSGLLLSCAIANQLLQGREDQAARGVAQLTEEMVASCPSWAAEGQEQPAQVELRSFINGLGSNDERFGRILNCAQAPWQLNDGTLPDENNPLWAGSCFALWCLLKMRPSPAKLKPLRPVLPALTQQAPVRARWLAGDLLLMLQLEVPADLSTCSEEGIIETTYQERAGMESALMEQLQHGRHSLQGELAQSSQVIANQHCLVEERQHPLPLAVAECESRARPGSSGSDWQQALDASLSRLASIRKGLGATLEAAEAKRQAAENAVREVLDLNLDDSNIQAEDRQLDSLISTLRQAEADYMARKFEQDQSCSDLSAHDAHVATTNSAMDEADKAVQQMRQRISDHETDISSKQRDVQSKRTLASSDLSSLRQRLSSELEEIKQRQIRVRERALQIQASNLPDGEKLPDGSNPDEEMAKLKAEAGRLKSRAAELQQQEQSVTADPQQLERQAQEAEEAVRNLCDQREGLRLELQQLEHAHLAARGAWQEAMTGLQAARQQKEFADLQGSTLKRQLESQWASWHPVWSRRLQLWKGRALALCRARQGSEMLSSAADLGWDGLRQEHAARQEVLSAAHQLQSQLAELAHGLSAIDDSMLG